MHYQDVETSIVMNANGSCEQKTGVSRIIHFSPGELSEDQIEALKVRFPGVFQFLSDGSGRSWASVSGPEVRSFLRDL